MVVWCGDVGNKLLERILTAGEDRRLILASRGGCVSSMRGCLDVLQENPWVTIGTGEIMSAAVPILAAGQKGGRFASARCRFMVHRPSADLPAATADGLAIEASEIRLLDNEYFEDLAKFTKMDAEWWRSRCSDACFYFGAKEAKRLGVIDKVG